MRRFARRRQSLAALAVLVVAAAIVAGALATSSQATPPGTSGRIVFERLRAYKAEMRAKQQA